MTKSPAICVALQKLEPLRLPLSLLQDLKQLLLKLSLIFPRSAVEVFAGITTEIVLQKKKHVWVFLQLQGSFLLKLTDKQSFFLFIMKVTLKLLEIAYCRRAMNMVSEKFLKYDVFCPHSIPTLNCTL